MRSNLELINFYKDSSDNKKSILRAIFKEQELSRNDMGELLKLSPATVTKFVSELINEGIIEEYGEKESTGGRKPVTLRIVPDYSLIICIDIGSHMTRIAVMKLNREIIEKQEYLTEDFDINNLISNLQNMLKTYNNKRFLGIGVGISGMVDYNSGKVIFCPNIQGLDGINLKELLEEKVGIYTRLDTSSRCMAVAEQWYGAGKGVFNQIVVSIGYGIGAGIILDSRIFRGNSGFAGELGHIQVEENSKRCTCGNYGCLENYVTLPLIISKIKERLASYKGYSPLKMRVKDIDEIKIEDIVEVLDKGDKVVDEEMKNIGRLIGVALTNMANIMNPRLIILGGGVIELFPVIIDSVRRTITERSLTPINQDLSVVRAFLGWDSPLVGNYILIINDFLR